MKFDYMKILVIEICNYIDYPTGGQLSFVRSMLKAFPEEEIKLVGVDTEGRIKTGVWSKLKIENKQFEYYSVGHMAKISQRPIIPRRISGVFLLKRHLNKILDTKFDFIFVQAPEVLLCIPDQYCCRVCLDMPGVSNPLDISRYKWAQILAGAFDKIYLKKVARVGTLLTTASSKDMDTLALRSNGLLSRDAMVQFPTRFDSSVFFPVDRQVARNRTGIKPETKLFVTVGRLNWFKGWKLMLEAFVRVREKYIDSVLVFIGDGEDKEAILGFAEHNRISEAILLLGRKPSADIACWLNAADCFVMGSFAEGWSTTLLEACACGVPCVITDFGSSEMIENGINGYVVKDRNIKQFADNMEKVLNIDRNSVISYNRKYEKYSIDNLRKSLLDLLLKES